MKDKTEDGAAQDLEINVGRNVEGDMVVLQVVLPEGVEAKSSVTVNLEPELAGSLARALVNAAVQAQAKSRGTVVTLSGHKLVLPRHGNSSKPKP